MKSKIIWGIIILAIIGVFVADIIVDVFKNSYE